ncbi:MAG: transposase [Clostridiales Family XIII bacterium]|nr:transposase [Clostridiales Family XIII bacterium]
MNSKICVVGKVKTKQLNGIHTLNKRTWKCEYCNSLNDKDINASINLESKVISSIVSACGEFYTAARAC